MGNRGIVIARKPDTARQASTRRWLKKHCGKMYTVSGRPLGCPDTKENSAAANAWWGAKRKEIESAPPMEEGRRVNAVKV